MLEHERAETGVALQALLDKAMNAPRVAGDIEAPSESDVEREVGALADAMNSLASPPIFDSPIAEAAHWVSFTRSLRSRSGPLSPTFGSRPDSNSDLYAAERYDAAMAVGYLAINALEFWRSQIDNGDRRRDEYISVGRHLVTEYRRLVSLERQSQAQGGDERWYTRVMGELLSLEKTLSTIEEDSYSTTMARLRGHVEMIKNLASEMPAAGAWVDSIASKALSAASAVMSDLLNSPTHREIPLAQTLDIPLPSSAPPSQVSGPHFAIVSGKIDFAPPDELDPEKNNISRLRSLLPVLRQEVRDALELFAGNRAFPKIHRVLNDYGKALEGTVEELDYNLIASFGLQLANAETAALRDISDRLMPEMEDDQLSTLRSILNLHGPFILSTEVGRSLLADAAAYDRTPEQETTFRQASVSLSEAISEEGIAADRAASFLVETAESIGSGSQPTRTAAFGTNTVRNASIALMVGAIAALPVALGFAPVSWIAAVLIAEGVKKSDVGVGAANAVRDAINDQKTNLLKLRPFILRHEQQLRTIAGDQREFRWLHDWLDWLKANTPPS
ncbi:hypothetical protein HFO06_04420 [Rhizobium leguminosarum]|uniref:hypothetical protein n=1 Tax=Rhizobium leguminosarum TaxID=384 RepID=UPI001C93EE6B|nr:hypothetical protein [Rhizobium leguminosarum]MBY5762360.1 hypothetical protein [Rhizobium leguminosarum]